MLSLVLLFAGLTSCVEPPKPTVSFPASKLPPNGTESDPRLRRLIGCTYLHILKFEKDSDEIKNFEVESATVSKERRHKIKALMLAKCMKEITDSGLKMVLEGDEESEIDPRLEPFVTINYAEMNKTGFDWTVRPEEAAMLKEAKDVSCASEYSG
ncbi:MAG: hypothetical protein P4L67_03515 [Candidatus Pacebacteria bacterium]|nr:hypothetical protein [Candidatus Paceibacterota bacterium]